MMGVTQLSYLKFRPFGMTARIFTAGASVRLLVASMHGGDSGRGGGCQSGMLCLT
jgi:hypothetical protein